MNILDGSIQDKTMNVKIRVIVVENAGIMYNRIPWMGITNNISLPRDNLLLNILL